MGFGYLGTSVSMSTNDVRQGLTAAQKIVDSIENDLRVLKGRGAPASVLGATQIKLRKATERRNELRARLKVLETRSASLAEKADDYDKRADAHRKQLLDALSDEARLRKSQTKRVENLLAEMRMDRDSYRKTVFASEKAKLGLAAALTNRIKRSTKGKQQSEAVEAKYRDLPLSKATRSVLVRHQNENQQFFRSVIDLDQNELAALNKAAQRTGKSVAVTSPAALASYQSNLLRNTKRSLSLSPGATVPSNEELRLLYIAVSRQLPRQKGETEQGYHMRIRRYVYRAAIRLGNYRQKYSGQKSYSVAKLQEAAVRDTVVTDSKALEEEAKANVFAPAGEQSVTAVVDAATGASAVVVPTPTTPSATYVASQTAEFVASTPAQQAAAASPVAEEAPVSDDVAVAVTEETPVAEDAAVTLPEDKPFWKRPLVLTAAAVALAVVGYRSMRSGQD